MKTLTSALLPQMPSAFYRIDSMPKFSHCSWGGIPLKWPCIEPLIFSVASANSGHVDLNVRMNPFCFCLTAIGMLNDTVCNVWKRINYFWELVFGFIFKIWRQTTPVSNPEEVTIILQFLNAVIKPIQCSVFHSLSLSHFFCNLRWRFYLFQVTLD